ncbi:protein translocase subunit SecD [Cellulomonas cellasea]|uniref:Protein translocase subunit SecD n=1 Tax=Cellulomonas cellasea TaxID=43670 RepID=A0A7W4YAI9_9CELL|nr:protein translocase subunit SecD [Cellulomonas cellasea]MBB2921832.1 preprotein translocase subunit SecD [Cellulomonas cellasea]
MAQPTRRHRPLRSLIILGGLVLALFGSLLAGSRWSDASLTPKLALDLEGGTQIILQPVTENDEEVTPETISEAIAVIRQRVDSSGVAEAEITSQGGRNIVVALPGRPDAETLALVRTSAQMELRPVLTVSGPAPVEDPAEADPAADPAATAAPTDGETAAADAAATPAPDAAATPAPEAAATPAPTETAAPSDEPGKEAPDNPSDLTYYATPKVQADFAALDCTDPANLTGGVQGPADRALVTCDPDGTAKYLLGPVEIQGTNIANATSGLEVTQTGATTNNWVVNMELDGEGTRIFRETTTRLQALTQPQNQFAMVLDGLVISAPSLATGVIISDGKAQISGDFTRETAATLASQLNFGALPLTFEVQSEEQISATLGAEQLEKGLIAGLIGLGLVVVYSLFQYRALGLVTVASLIAAGVLTFGVISVLSWTQGYRLSLPGVAGLIVAIGITADSFIVYFERIRDELRDGRTLQAAVDKGWERARQTILASDAVNFLAAIVLYLLAVGGVRGFAFTLGLTTVIDLVVVFLFTHPLMLLLARTKFFGEGHPLSGLDRRRLGGTAPRYAGRGRVVSAGNAGTSSLESTSEPKVPVTAGVGGSGQTIAQRRAAAAAAARTTEPGPDAAAPEPSPGDGAAEPTSGRTEGNEH